MRMPGFTAEASLYKTEERYLRQPADAFSAKMEGTVQPAARCSGGGGTCECDGGCSASSGGCRCES